jgi:hypothetical protein
MKMEIEVEQNIIQILFSENVSECDVGCLRDSDASNEFVTLQLSAFVVIVIARQLSHLPSTPPHPTTTHLPTKRSPYPYPHHPLPTAKSTQAKPPSPTRHQN